MDAAIVIFKWMSVHKTEGQNRRRYFRMEILNRPVLEGDHAVDRRGKVTWPGTDMTGQQHVRISIVFT